ncbi:MAG: RNase adapter RapZ [Spongiibacteraceae bacterium]|nr:RNase adapter RapZ [Spongiibacteraceae bacterium]
MKLVIISGRSGSGKSSALNLLEDEGYYCIDNLPVTLIPELVSYVKSSNAPEHDKVAICIDARNSSQDLSSFVELLNNKPTGVDINVVFLDADSDKLIKRFSKTRRRHPLSNKNTGLREAIQSERILLEPIVNEASLTIDTSEMSLHDLRATIKAQLVDNNGASISVLFQSFGFKRGVPSDADIVYDLRILPNPHWDPSLRTLTGKDQAVIEFLDAQSDVEEMFSDINGYLKKWLPKFEQNNRSYITIAIGCTGGQHRSVYMAQRLANDCAKRYDNVQVRHRELHLQTQ